VPRHYSGTLSERSQVRFGRRSRLSAQDNINILTSEETEVNPHQLCRAPRFGRLSKQQIICLWRYIDFGQDTCDVNLYRPLALVQRFSNFFEVGTTFISQNSSADLLTIVPFESKFIIF
jgi:hypothetical protein